MSQHKFLLPIVLIAAAQCAYPAIAGFQFGGSVTVVNDPSNATSGQVTVGTPVTGEFRYDTTSPNTCTPALGCFADTSHISTFSPLGSFLIQLHAVSGTLDFLNDVTGSGLYVMLSDGSGGNPYPQQFEMDGLTSEGVAPAGFGTPAMSLLLFSAAPHQFLTTHDLTTQMIFSETADGYMAPSFSGFSGIYGDNYQIQFRLDRIDSFQPLSLASIASPDVANAPEPAAILYLGLGLGLFAVRKRLEVRN
jgi:hypothetical protein